MGKSLFFVTWMCNEGLSHGHGQGSTPYRHSDSSSRLWAVSKTGQFKRRGTSAFSLSLSCAPGLSPCSRNSWAGSRSAGLSPWNQPSKEVQDRAKAVTTQTQHQLRDSNTAPRWRHATATRASRVSQSNTWIPTCETRQRSSLLNQKASITN